LQLAPELSGLVVEANRGRIWTTQGNLQQPISSKEQFQTALESLDANFGVVSDIANASKHMVLPAHRARAGLSGNADTLIEELDVAFHRGAFDTTSFDGGVRNIYVKSGPHRHNVVVSVKAVYSAWVRLNAENSW
jgi:hypothetical protein